MQKGKNFLEAIVSEYLSQHGYSALRSAMPQVEVFFRVEGNLAMAILMIDGRQFILDVPSYQNMKDQVGRMFEAKGYTNVCVFTIFLTPNITNVHEIARNDSFFWAIDLGRKRLCIFDNGMRDFDGLRDGLADAINMAASRPVGDKTVGQWIIDHTVRNPAPATVCLILLNIIAFIAVTAFGSSTDLDYMISIGALYAPAVFDKAQFYRLFTCMFLHFGVEHLGANMFALALFGSRVERIMGSGRYLLLYILSGLAASMMSLGTGVFLHSTNASVGASGAVFGIIGALFAILIRNRGRLGSMTAGRAAFLITYSIFSGFMAKGIDNAAHIGGLLMGLILGFILYRVPKRTKPKNEQTENMG